MTFALAPSKLTVDLTDGKRSSISQPAQAGRSRRPDWRHVDAKSSRAVCGEPRRGKWVARAEPAAPDADGAERCGATMSTDYLAVILALLTPFVYRMALDLARRP